MNDLLLNKNIYVKRNIQVVIEVFKKLCKVTIEENSKYWELTFSECVYDKTRTVKEFENYLIDYINSEGSI